MFSLQIRHWRARYNIPQTVVMQDLELLHKLERYPDVTYASIKAFRRVLLAEAHNLVAGGNAAKSR